jgi:hypothetical protein
VIPDRVSACCPCAVAACGHPRSSHYDYILNGRDQQRCRDCDPTAGLPAGLYEAQGDTYAAAMMAAADHWYEPPPAQGG